MGGGEEAGHGRQADLRRLRARPGRRRRAGLLGLLTLGGLASLGAVLACGPDAPPTPPSDPDDVDRCPEPGPGVEIGGFAGTGDDTFRIPQRRLVLMGGGREEDRAARLFVEASGAGDIVVLRASGSLTSYPEYFIGAIASVTPATVVTVRTSDPEAGADPAVLCRVARAEAVWLAGGDQWNYLGRWPAVLHDSLAAVAERGATMGGTSAGAVVLGEGAFDAQYGTVTSAEALADPLRQEVSVSAPVFAQPELEGVLVDSHFMDRRREGRLLVFLARLLAERGEGQGPVVGVGLDEGAALTLEVGEYLATSRGAGAVWLYEVAGPATLADGVPLSLEGIRRVRLPAGRVGRWPFDFDASADARELRVDGGSVVVVPRP